MADVAWSPNFVIGRDRCDDAGLLSESDGQRVAEVLRRGGFVLLPSDTAYSVAALPVTTTVVDELNVLLGRPDKPVSLAFGEVRDLRRWVLPDPLVDRLVAEYCPGPVTIVCRVALNIPDVLLNQTVASRNHTVGVRITDSAVERQVATLTAYPVTTVAVRYPDTDAVVTRLDDALDLVRDRVHQTGFRDWCAVEGGDINYDRHSTVVEVVRDERGIVRIRDGAIPFEDIRAVANGMSRRMGNVPDGDDHV